MEWPLVGRDAELEAVAAVLADGGAGTALRGPAGVGKSRLAREAARRAEAAGGTVVWARASRSAATMPLGAFAGLLPAALPAGAELLARARHAVADRAGSGRLVLCVEDAHLLDDASAVLLGQLVGAGEAFALLTVRAGEPVPDALRALWKDELCAVIDLDPLSEPDVEALLAAALDGPVDGATVHAVWRRTGGNPLFVRELVRHGLATGALAGSSGVWRWRGPIAASTGLADLVDLGVEDLDAGAGAALERVVVGGPLEVPLAGDSTALDALERDGLVERRTDGRRRFVDAGHPLHAEAVRARLTDTRLDALRTRLADGLATLGARRAGDELRIATWRLEAGRVADGALFERAAERALAILDPDLAQRLAAAAIDAGADAGLIRARSLAATGRAAEAEEQFAALAARPDADRAAIAHARARNLFWALGEAEAADDILRTAADALPEGAGREGLVAQRARMAAAAGRPEAALRAAQALLERPSVAPGAGLAAAMAAVEAFFSSGRSDAAIELAERWLPVAPAHRGALPTAEPVLLSMRAVALRLAGRLREATASSEATYRHLLRGRSPTTTAVEAAHLGLTWLGRGRVRTAERLGREGAALLRTGDAPGMLAFALACVAQAAAQAGDAGGAAAAAQEMERTPLGHPAFAAELGLARAWTAAVQGEGATARAHARAAAERAAGRGQLAYAVRAWHELARLGDPGTAAPALADLAGEVDGPFAGVALAHAEALAARDGPALRAAAERLAELDALLAAAETAQAAAAAHATEGRADSARSAAARAALWLSPCEGARPPGLHASPDAAELTTREREVAELAARGASSREIAERLVVSVRTVDNHLQSVYRKLDVNRRTDLGEALGL